MGILDKLLRTFQNVFPAGRKKKLSKKRNRTKKTAPTRTKAPSKKRKTPVRRKPASRKSGRIKGARSADLRTKRGIKKKKSGVPPSRRKPISGLAGGSTSRRKTGIKKRTSGAGPGKKRTKKQVRPAAAGRKGKPRRTDKSSEVKRTLVGEVTHYFSRIEVCVIKMTAGTIRLGERLIIESPDNRVIQEVRSLQIENSDVREARKGQLVGLKVDQKLKPGMHVYLEGR